MKGHYLMLVLADGKSDVRREYVELVREDETISEATARWLDTKVAGRKRNVQKARDKAEAGILHRRICRPSSWYREQQETSA